MPRPESDEMPDLAVQPEAHGSLESLYGPIVVDHITNPRNVGVVEGVTAIGTVDDPDTENLIMIYVRVEHDRVCSASFRALACSACVASSSMATLLLKGRALSDGPLTAETLLKALGGLPESKRHCAELAARAANLALAAC